MKTFFAAEYRRIREGNEGSLESVYLQNDKAYFTSESDATEAANLDARINRNNVIAVPRAIIVYESFSEYQQIVDAGLRDQAMKNLTSEQKRVLGLTDEILTGD